jgi:peroxiredoxin
MIGDSIPAVTLVTPDRQPVVLRDALAKQPTILIYYRGGW